MWKIDLNFIYILDILLYCSNVEKWTPSDIEQTRDIEVFIRQENSTCSKLMYYATASIRQEDPSEQVCVVLPQWLIDFQVTPSQITQIWPIILQEMLTEVWSPGDG